MIDGTTPGNFPWRDPMPDEQFAVMQAMCGTDRPVGYEAAYRDQVLKPYYNTFMQDGWLVREFAGNASYIVDTNPENTDMLTVMVVGHSDTIRMQVREIGDDGKVWISCDSHLPATLLGYLVTIFTCDPETGEFNRVETGTVEAFGAIHFTDAPVRTGDVGVKPDQLYIELGADSREEIAKLGIREGDPVVFHRKIERGAIEGTFMGSFLDNGLGCFVAAEVARLVAADPEITKKVRCLFGAATHEEIGRFGSRVVAGEHKPNIVIATDVSHDLAAAPDGKKKRRGRQAMRKGCTIATGSVIHEGLRIFMEQVCAANGVPYQLRMVGRDTGTDGMAAVLACIDAAAASLGFPIRSMHTISERGYTRDILACIYAIYFAIKKMAEMSMTVESLKEMHPRIPLRA